MSPAHTGPLETGALAGNGITRVSRLSLAAASEWIVGIKAERENSQEAFGIICSSDPFDSDGVGKKKK